MSCHSSHPCTMKTKFLINPLMNASITTEVFKNVVSMYEISTAAHKSF